MFFAFDGGFLGKVSNPVVYRATAGAAGGPVPEGLKRLGWKKADLAACRKGGRDN
jgi:hypothetical protein